MVSVPLLGCLSEPFEGEPPVVSARYETVALQLPAGTDDEEENDAGRHNHASQNGRFRTRRSALIAAARQAQAEYARDQRDATARILAAAAQGNGAVTAADIRQRQAP